VKKKLLIPKIKNIFKGKCTNIPFFEDDMKRLLFLVLVIMIATSSAAPSKRVKSKRGDLEITKDKGGGNVVCTVGFSEEMSIVKDGGTDVLVKASCGQGWIGKNAIEYVAAEAGDKSMRLDDVDVIGWIDNPSAVFVLDQDAADFDGVDIDRDFKEYLQHTMDREQVEMRNNEN
jgi:hypothetical protein